MIFPEAIAVEGKPPTSKGPWLGLDESGCCIDHQPRWWSRWCPVSRWGTADHQPQRIINAIDTLWWTNIAMENHHFSWENPLFLWPFSHCYVSSPEGISWYIQDILYLLGSKGPGSLFDLIDISCQSRVIWCHFFYFLLLSKLSCQS